MASKKLDKKTTSTKRKLPPKKAPAKRAATPKKEKKEPKFTGPRHPHGRVKATSQGSKEALAKALAPALARDDEDKAGLEARLKTASNNQLLRLQKVADAVKSKYGSRAGLIETIGKNAQKSTDKDYIAKLESMSLPNLLDIAKSADRRARA